MLAAFCIWRLDDLLFVINRFPLSLHNGVSCTKKKKIFFSFAFFHKWYNWIRKIMESCCLGRNKINPLFCRDLGKEAIQWRWKDWKGKKSFASPIFFNSKKKSFHFFSANLISTSYLCGNSILRKPLLSRFVSRPIDRIENFHFGWLIFKLESFSLWYFCSLE